MTSCPRSITFTIPGASGSPGVLVTAVENGGDIDFTVDVLDTSTLIGDLRGLFFQFNEAKLSTLSVTHQDPSVSGSLIKANSVNDLGQGNNMNGAASPFDVGLSFGTPGIGKGDDVSGPVHFTLHAATALTLDDFAHQQFGARVTSTGAPGGARSGSEKIVAIAPAAPDAYNDSYAIFEDGQSGPTSPSHTPQGVLFTVLANDTDADGDKLRITNVEGAHHGTLQIVDGPDADTLPGDAILYTADSDYAGPDSFTYCVTDDHGGTDSADVTVAVAAVADVPTLTYKVSPGDTVDQIRLSVTATQTDADNSEFIDRIELSGLPADVTVSEASFNPSTQPGSLTHEFVLTLPHAADVSFNLGVTAVSREVSNGDEQTATTNVPIVLEYTRTTADLTFHADDQSMWSTGDQFTFTDDRFLGLDTSWNTSGGGFVHGSTDGHIRAGFQSTLNFEGGEIDALVPYDITVETSYNHTTDVLFLTADAVLGSATFTTDGPEGSYVLDFIFDFLAHASAGFDLGALGSYDIFNVTVGPYNENFNILNITSDDLNFTIPLPAGFSLDFAWPDLDTTSVPSSSNVFTSDGASNNFLQLNLDVDELVFTLLGLPNPFDIGFDFDVASGSIELADLDLAAGLNFLQSFQLAVNSLVGTITFEDGSTQVFDFNQDITLNHASSLDLNHDGHIAFELELAPNATLHNDTDIGINVGYQFDVLKLSGSYDIVVDSGSLSLGPVFSVDGSTPVTSFNVYDQTFGLDFQPRDLLLAA